MKPRDILEKYNIKFKGWYEAQADTRTSILPYVDKDCIIAYRKGFIGFVMIIKSVRSHFAYIGIQKEIYLGGMDYVFRRCKLKQAVKLMGDKAIILNEKEMERIKDKTLFDGLKDE